MLSGPKGDQTMSAAVAANAYRHAEIDTLSPRDLLVKLFECMERSIDEGALAMQNRHYEMSARSCRRIRDILFELQATLNHEAGGEIAGRLDEIYRFLVKEVVEADWRKDVARLRGLKGVITPLREGWQGIPDAEAYTSSLGGGGGNVSRLNLKT